MRWRLRTRACIQKEVEREERRWVRLSNGRAPLTSLQPVPGYSLFHPAARDCYLEVLRFLITLHSIRG